jgi:hypothetical protein
MWAMSRMHSRQPLRALKRLSMRHASNRASIDAVSAIPSNRGYLGSSGAQVDQAHASAVDLDKPSSGVKGPGERACTAHHLRKMTPSHRDQLDAVPLADLGSSPDAGYLRQAHVDVESRGASAVCPPHSRPHKIARGRFCTAVTLCRPSRHDRSVFVRGEKKGVQISGR